MGDISFDTCTCGSVVVSDAQAVAELKADNDRLRAALKHIAWEQTESDKPHLIARAALNGEEDHT